MMKSTAKIIKAKKYKNKRDVITSLYHLNLNNLITRKKYLLYSDVWDQHFQTIVINIMENNIKKDLEERQKKINKFCQVNFTNRIAIEKILIFMDSIVMYKDASLQAQWNIFLFSSSQTPHDSLLYHYFKRKQFQFFFRGFYYFLPLDIFYVIWNCYKKSS